MMQNINLMICGTQRSGSYLLSELLAKTGQVPFAEEWITPFHLSDRRRAFGLPADMPQWQVLGEIVRRERRNGVFAVKQMWRSLEAFLNDIRHNHAEFSPRSDESLLRDLLGGEIHYIMLTRQDKIRQAVSYAKARQTGHWRQQDDALPYRRDLLLYTYSDVAQAADDVSRAEDKWYDFFDRAGIQPLTIIYEDLLGNTSVCLEAILSHIGLNAQTREIAPEASQKPMSDGINQQWFKRHNELNTRIRQLESNGNIRAISQCDKRCSWRMLTTQTTHTYPDAARLDIQLCNESKSEWQPLGHADGSLWLRIHAYLRDADGQRVSLYAGSAMEGYLVHGEIHEPLAAGACAIVPLRIPAPTRPGSYRLEIEVIQQGNAPAFTCLSPDQSVDIVWQWPEPRRTARRLWPETEDLLTTWQYLPWLGYFLDDKFPWIFHADHEWWYVEEHARPGPCYHIHDVILGELAIDPACYPRMQAVSQKRPLRFIRREGNSRVFEWLDNGETITIPVNEPELWAARK